MFYDYAHLHEIEKRVQTRALNGLLQNTREALAEDAFQLSQAIQAYLGKLATLAEFPVSFEQADLVPALLKAAEFRVNLQDLPACEALYENMALLHSLLRNQCSVLINAHAYFSPEELTQLYKMAQYRKIPLLLLESHAPSPLEAEEMRVYDADMCELRLEEGDEIR